MKKVLIIGGVAGGASCAARLRRLDETAQIILIERGPYISYANCGLPYHVGGIIASRNALLVTPEAVMRNRFRVDVRTNNEAIAIHRNAKTVTIRKTVIRQFKSAHHLHVGASSVRLRKTSRFRRLVFLRLYSAAPPFPNRTRCAGLRFGAKSAGNRTFFGQPSVWKSRVKRLSFLRFFPDLDRLSPWERDFSALPQLPEIRAETPG